jgi:hypothetical protein
LWLLSEASAVCLLLSTWHWKEIYQAGFLNGIAKALYFSPRVALDHP